MKKLFIGIFGLVLFAPIFIKFFGIPVGGLNSENRNLVAAPTLEWTYLGEENSTFFKKFNAFFEDLYSYKEHYDAYYRDNFILKSLLFDSYKDLKQNVFQVDPIPHKVIKGKEGWYFLGNSFSEVVEESFGLNTLTQYESEQILKNVKANQEWFKEQGIDYYIAIAPNKHSIYNQYLGIRQSEGLEKEIDQLPKLMFNAEKFIDLGVGLKEIDEQLFLKGNTHWNDLGAYYGYVNLIKGLRVSYPDLKLIERSELKDSSFVSDLEDLTAMLGIPANENKIAITLKNPKARDVEKQLEIPENVNPITYEIRRKSDANTLKILVCRDSFSTDMIQYISESFGESVFIWNQIMSKELILKEKPDLVIHEFIERDIQTLSYETLKP